MIAAHHNHYRMYRYAVSTITSLLFLFLATMLSSCETAEPASTQNTMSALVDNSAWRAVDVSARHQDSTITIEGTSAIGISIKLALHGDSTGTYALGKVINQGTYSDGPVSWVTFGVGAGTVTVTQIDSLHVVGFFGFHAKDTIGTEQSHEITNGTFDIDLTP